MTRWKAVAAALGIKSRGDWLAMAACLVIDALLVAALLAWSH